MAVPKVSTDGLIRQRESGRAIDGVVRNYEIAAIRINKRFEIFAEMR
jgi:hypothetical protein